jgi:hypothetical protein
MSDFFGRSLHMVSKTETPGSTISPADLAPILQKLQSRERGRALLRIMAFIFGLPLALVGPLVLGTMFWFACGMLYQWYPWLYFFLGTSVVAIPALFVTELRTAGNYLSEAVTPAEAKQAAIAQNVKMAGTAMVPQMGNTLALAAVLASPRVSAAGFVEVFLTGPRLLLTAFRDTDMLKKLHGADLQLAAILLRQLLQARVGIPTKKLLRPGQTMKQIEQPLAYLVYYDWTGVAADGSKVWILTQSIEELK